MARIRLDTLLTQRGLMESRSRAAAAVMAGQVHLGPGRRRAEKPGQLVAPDVDVSVEGAQPYVSRGGIKLANALDALGVDPAGRSCLDVAYGELHWSLREHRQVTVIERVNARALERGQLPYRPDLVVADLSFISLTKVLPAVLACVAERFDCLAMVKPQFEVGREAISRGGVVRHADDRRRALAAVATDAAGLGVSVQGFASSGLPGPSGNRETFLWLAEAGRTGAIADFDAALEAVDA